MKSLSVRLAVILLVVGLTIFYAKAWAAEWKEFARATTGVFHYDEASMSSTPEGLIRVWIHNVTTQETNLVEFDCQAKHYHVLDVIQYDEGGRIKSRETYYNNPTPTWYDIPPKSVPEPLSVIVCP